MNDNLFTGANFSAFWGNLLLFGERALGFLVTIFIGHFVCRFLGNLCTRGLRRVNFDHVVERSGMGQAVARGGWDPAKTVGTVVYFGLFLFVLQLAFGFFGPNPISTLLTQTIAFLPNIFVALVIVVVSAYIAGTVKQILTGALGGLNYGRTLAFISAAAILFVGIFAALDQLAIAPAIVNGLFYAVLAVIVGSAIVAIGGGGIAPMRAIWERSINRLETEVPRFQQHVASNSPAEQVAQRPYLSE